MQRKPYNLSKLLYYIVKAAPKAKKLNIADSLNTDSDNWAFNDKKMNYKYKIRKSFGDIVADFICEGMDDGADLRELVLGIPGICECGELRHVGSGTLWKFAKYLTSFLIRKS